MIQRIQTVWLFLAALCAALTYKFPFYTGNVPDNANMQTFEKLVASSNFILLVFTAGLTIGTLIIIFLYKNRKQQLWLSLVAAAIAVIDIVLYFTEMKKFTSGSISLTAVFALAIPVLLVLAAIGIRKDDKLVKSLDRLR